MLPPNERVAYEVRGRDSAGCSAGMFYVSARIWYAVLHSSVRRAGQVQKQRYICYLIGSVAASEAVSEDFIADELSDRTYPVATKL